MGLSENGKRKKKKVKKSALMQNTKQDSALNPLLNYHKQIKKNPYYVTGFQ